MFDVFVIVWTVCPFLPGTMLPVLTQDCDTFWQQEAYATEADCLAAMRTPKVRPQVTYSGRGVATCIKVKIDQTAI